MMIKGINHTMIEVHETGNEYYERAILIIKPEYASVQRTILEEEARRMLKELDAPSAIRSSRFRWRWAILVTGAAAIGSLITWIICSYL